MKRIYSQYAFYKEQFVLPVWRVTSTFLFEWSPSVHWRWICSPESCYENRFHVECMKDLFRLRSACVSIQTDLTLLFSIQMPYEPLNYAYRKYVNETDFRNHCCIGQNALFCLAHLTCCTSFYLLCNVDLLSVLIMIVLWTLFRSTYNRAFLLFKLSWSLVWFPKLNQFNNCNQ